MKRLDVHALVSDGVKGALIGIGISAVFMLISIGFPTSVLNWIFLIGFGLGIGFLLTVGNELVGIVIQYFFPVLKKWRLFNCFLTFPVSTVLFYLIFSLFYCWIPFRERLTYSMGAGIASTMVGLFFIYAQEKEERIRLEQENRRLAVLEERNRIARELHDSVSQNLFGISLHLNTFEYLRKQNPEAFRKSVRQLREMVTETQVEMGLLVYELRPVVMEKGFYEALESLSGLYRARYRLSITTCFKGNEENLKGGVQTALYRVTQEALNNIVKHAKARFVQVEMEIGPQGNGILLIRDDGQGFDKEESSRKICYGLRGMKERVSELNGEVKINSVKGKGTTVTVFF